MRFGVVVFPGSNCDHDCYHVVSDVLGSEARFLWHKDRDLAGSDVLLLPGGFSYGDYLRAGAMARFSPIMDEVVAFAKRGGPVLGICNGFQVLTEAGLLPGALLTNRGLKFLCRDVTVTAENVARSPFTRALAEGEVLTMPIAHYDGCFYADDDTVERLEGEGQVAFRYVGADGARTSTANPNGSVHDIAGVRNEAGNVVGLMPHPERAAEDLLGHREGIKLFQGVLDASGVMT